MRHLKPRENRIACQMNQCSLEQSNFECLNNNAQDREGTSSVNKSSSPNNYSNQQDTQPTTNIQSTSAPSTLTYVPAEENNDNQAEEEHLQDDEFNNPFCAPV
nr:hypothetical protein [Tanacetum cinerariifolium]